MSKKLPDAIVLKKLYDRGFSIKRIAKIYNVSHQAVSDKMRRHGYTPDKAVEHQSSQLGIELTPLIIEYREKGFTYAKISEFTGVSDSTVKRICKKHNVKKGVRHTRLSDYELGQVRAMRKLKHSDTDIGASLGYDTMTIWRARKEFDIK